MVQKLKLLSSLLAVLGWLSVLVVHTSAGTTGTTVVPPLALLGPAVRPSASSGREMPQIARGVPFSSLYWRGW